MTTATDTIPIVLTDEERDTLRREIPRKLRGIAEECGEDLTESARRLRAAADFLNLSLGHDELPRDFHQTRAMTRLLREWRNEARICALYEDGDERDLIAEDEAAAAAFGRVFDQVEAAQEADATRRLAAMGVTV